VGETTAIAWTDSTSNAWHGCEKVDALCKHCYAEVSTPVRVKRAHGLEVWGGDAARSETKSWERDLRKWNAAALASGKVHRVFCQSLSDTFEDYHGGRVVRAAGIVDGSLDALRSKYLRVIEECTALTFQMLTKRPENVRRMVPSWWLTAWPAHVWIGTSVGDQESAEKRIPHLLRVPAAVRFLSVEPQLGPVDLSRYMPAWFCDACGAFMLGRGDDGCDPDEGEAEPRCSSCRSSRVRAEGISWCIVGGESGSKARSLRDQCKRAGVACFLKQLGAHPMTTWEDVTGAGWTPGTKFWQRLPGDTLHRLKFADSHGGDEAEWPADLQGCRAFPVTP
jgi:protein gp37